MQQNEFQHIPATFWVYILLPFAVILVTLIGIRTHNPFMFGLIGVIPFCILLLNRIDLWLVTIFVVYNSKLRIPGVLGQLELVHILIAGLIGVVFLRWIIVKHRVPRRAWMWRFIYLFGAVLILTIAVRGTGFRFLGDHMWGGMRYVELMLTLAFPFVATSLRITVQQWRFSIIAMSLVALVPVLADLLFVVSNGAIYHQYYLIKHGTVREAFQTYGTGEMTRFVSGAAGGAAIITLPFVLFPFIARHAWKYVILVFAGLVMSSLSGHRLGILTGVAFVWIFSFLVLKRHRLAVLLVSGLVGLVGLWILILLAPHLPLSMQRAVSFIPFLDVDLGVAISSQGTIEWRLNVWRNAISEIPNYWMLGKGFTFDPELLASATANRNVEDWARIQVSYHNGWLSLLIGMGALGLIAGLGILFTVAARHYRISKSTWHNPSLQQFHMVFLVLYLVQAVVYLTLYGDVFSSFPGLFKLMAVLEGLVVANQALQPAAEGETAGATRPHLQFRRISAAG